ncbi:MAG: ABC transporter ATP-binding protein [Chloroflexota bacterium]|nr:ABC transporter ATP-binding protein [Chloroflexota bacterium]
MGIFMRILGMAWRHPRHMLAAYIALIGSSAFALMVPRLLGQTVDDVLGGSDFNAMLRLAGLILLVNGLRGVFAYGQTYLSEWTSQLVAYDIRNAMFSKLQHLSFSYHDKRQTGDQMSRATADVEAIRNFVQGGLLRAVQIFILIFGAAGLLFITNWRLALIGLAFVPIVAYRATVVSFSLRVIWNYVLSTTGKMTTVLQENLSGVRVVRAFGAQNYEIQKFDVVIKDLSESHIKVNKVQIANSSFIQFMFAAATGSILWFGGQEITAGRLTPGELTQFIFYLGLIQGPVRMSGMIINNFSRAVSAGQRIFEVLDEPSSVQQLPDAKTMPKIRGHVRFKNVSFTYGDEPILRDVSLEAQPGQVIALLGMPGSGKTTVVHLIPRFYDVTEGCITLDGIDVRDATLDSLRNNVGIAMQDVFLFSATIADNISYGKPGTTQEEVERAARIAQLHEFVVELPDGYDTWVGERGITLSGGQRQRLAIARTVLLDPPILVLDDSTSSIDAGTEHLLREALESVMHGRTTFVIAHRLSTVMHADQIIVLDMGTIAEQGTHRELVQQNGLYRQLYELQLLPAEPTIDGLASSSQDSDVSS